MAAHAVVALETHDHHRRRGFVDRVRDRGLEPGALVHRAVDEYVEAGDLREVEAQRRGEDLLENVLVLNLRQEVENAAAVVVADDDGRPDAMAPDRPEAVHVVIDGQVAKQKHRRNVALAGGDAETGGDEAIDSTGAAVAIETLEWFGERPESVGGADRHARTDEDLSGIRQP